MNKFRKLIFLALILVACDGPSVPAKVVPGWWKVKVQPGVVSGEQAAAQLAKVNVAAFNETLGWALVKSDDDPRFMLAKENYQIVEPVYVIEALTPVSTKSDLWNLELVGAYQAHEAGWNGDGIVVAIVDSGTVVNIREFPNARPCYSVLVEGCDKVHPHGTHVASIALGWGYGVAPGATLLPVKVLDRKGHGNDWDVATGINHSVSNGAKVINLSLGGSFRSAMLCEAVADAWDSGALPVAASGNNGGRDTAWPAACDKTVAVGSTKHDDTLSWWSNKFANKAKDFAMVAPGENVCAVTPNGPECWSGTSMASPHVAGAAAILMQKYHDASLSSIVGRLRNGAQDLGIAGPDDAYGSGRLNVWASLGGGPPPPTPTATAYPEPSSTPTFFRATDTPTVVSTVTPTVRPPSTTITINDIGDGEDLYASMLWLLKMGFESSPWGDGEGRVHLGVKCETPAMCESLKLIFERRWRVLP